MAEARVLWSEDVARRFEERLKERLKVALRGEAADFKSTTVKQKRRPSFLRAGGGWLVQVEVAYSNKTRLFWCLYFHGETDADAIVEPFLDRETSIADVIEEVKNKRGQDCIQIDDFKTMRDYVVEVMNYELAREAYGGEAGLLLNDLDSRTVGMLDWPTPLLKSEKLEVRKRLRANRMQVHPDTDHSLRVEACMVERDALVWREFRVFTEDNSEGLYDQGRKGEVFPGKREPEVLVEGLPDNCRPRPGASLGFPEERFAADADGWEKIPPEDVSSILSDLHRHIKPVLDPTQLRRFRRQHLNFYDDLALLEIIIEPAKSDERSIAYILCKPGLALPLDRKSTAIHQANKIVGAERHGPVIRNENEAAAYVAFIGRHVWGPDGPWIVLNSKDELIGQLDLTDAKSDQVDSIGAANAAPTGTKVEPSGAFKVVAWVLYGKRILKATFEVLADGSIKMTNIERIMKSAPVQGNGYLPYHKLESVSDPGELKPLAASELEKEYGQETVVKDRVLTGQLTRETLHIRNFRRCRFRGRVTLQLLVSDRGLEFEECVFENGLDLSGASLNGTLSLTDCLLVPVPGRHNELIDTAQPFSFDRLSADWLQIDGLWSTVSLSAKGVQIHGAVQLSKMMTLGGIDFRQSAIEQCFDFQDVRTGKNADGSSIELYGAVIRHNYVSFKGVTLTGDLSASFLQVGTAFFLESDAAPNSIGGSIELGAANIPKLLRIRNTHVGKSIKAKLVATGEVRILGGHLQSERPKAAVEEFRTSHIGGFIDLTDAEIQHDVTLVDLEVGSSRREVTGSDASLRLRNAKVGGNVRLFLEAKDAKAQGWLYAGANAGRDFAGKWRRGLDLKNAAILGDVDLSGVQCRAGGISLEEAEIQRDLHIRKRASGHRAAATHLAMAGLKCQGAADITGLKLPAYPRPAAGRPDGAVIADRATFANKLVVAVSENLVETSATIPGRLDLSGSMIGELAVSYSSFSFKPDHKHLTVGDQKKLDDKNLMTYGIILNRARLDKLSVFKTLPDDKRKCQYPQPIDLRFAEIKWWEFQDGRNSKSDDAGDYLELLKGDRHFQRHTFSSIEQSLFNRGHDDAADEVHKAMRERLRDEGNDKLGRRLKNRFFDWLTHSTTSPWRCIRIVVIWTLFSTLCVFSNPANIGPSEGGLTAHREWQADRVPTDTEWGWRSGVWMAVRFHVPVALLTARSAWAPANGRELAVSLPLLPKWSVSLPGISPEDYANFVLALHFLIWPVILVIGSRKFFMRLGK